jgi:hypothetical protein
MHKGEIGGISNIVWWVATLRNAYRIIMGRQLFRKVRKLGDEK